MLLRHSASVRGSGNTCKARGGRAQRGVPPPSLLPSLFFFFFLIPPQLVPHLPSPPRAAAAAGQGSTREVNRERRKWRAGQEPASTRGGMKGRERERERGRLRARSLLVKIRD